MLNSSTVNPPSSVAQDSEDLRRVSPDSTASALAQIEQMMRGVRYGELTIKIQDGQVVLIERLTRLRLR